MTGSSACSDAVLLALAEARGPALVALGAGGAGDELTDDGVVALAASCRNLRALFLPNCAALTAASAEALQRQSTALRVAVFAGCPNVPLCHLHVGSPHRFGADAHLFIGGDGRGTFGLGSRPQIAEAARLRADAAVAARDAAVAGVARTLGMPRPGSSGMMAALPATSPSSTTKLRRRRRAPIDLRETSDTINSVILAN